MVIFAAAKPLDSYQSQRFGMQSIVVNFEQNNTRLQNLLIAQKEKKCIKGKKSFLFFYILTISPISAHWLPFPRW